MKEVAPEQGNGPESGRERLDALRPWVLGAVLFVGAHLILQLDTLHSLLLVCSPGAYRLISMPFPLLFSSATAVLGNICFHFIEGEFGA